MASDRNAKKQQPFSMDDVVLTNSRVKDINKGSKRSLESVSEWSEPSE